MIKIKGKVPLFIITAAAAISSVSLAGAAIPNADHKVPPPHNRFVVTSIVLTPDGNTMPFSRKPLACFDQKGDCTAIVTVNFDVALPGGIPVLVRNGPEPLMYQVALQHVHSMDEIRQRLPAEIDKIPAGTEDFLRLFHEAAKNPVE